MTVTQVLDYIKNIHNEANAATPNWSDQELYALIEAKCNQILTVIGLVEGKTTSATVIGTADYAFPTDFIRIRRVWYNGQPLKYITFRQYEARQPSGVAPSGQPREFLIWNNNITVTPTPDAIGTLTFFGEKQQSAITNGSDTIDIPSVFHPALCDGVISDMFVKDENPNLASIYEQRWVGIHIPSMREFVKRRRRRGMPSVVIDSDSSMETEYGVI